MGETCRDAVLEAFARLEARSSERVFKCQTIVDEVLQHTTSFEESTIRTHVVARMCTNAPVNHTPKYHDLERVARGMYRRIR